VHFDFYITILRDKLKNKKINMCNPKNTGYNGYNKSVKKSKSNNGTNTTAAAALTEAVKYIEQLKHEAIINNEKWENERKEFVDTNSKLEARVIEVRNQCKQFVKGSIASITYSALNKAAIKVQRDHNQHLSHVNEEAEDRVNAILDSCARTINDLEEKYEKELESVNNDAEEARLMNVELNSQINYLSNDLAVSQNRIDELLLVLSERKPAIAATVGESKLDNELRKDRNKKIKYEDALVHTNEGIAALRGPSAAKPKESAFVSGTKIALITNERDTIQAKLIKSEKLRYDQLSKIALNFRNMIETSSQNEKALYAMEQLEKLLHNTYRQQQADILAYECGEDEQKYEYEYEETQNAQKKCIRKTLVTPTAKATTNHGEISNMQKKLLSSRNHTFYKQKVRMESPKLVQKFEDYKRRYFPITINNDEEDYNNTLNESTTTIDKNIGNRYTSKLGK